MGRPDHDEKLILIATLIFRRTVTST